MALNLLPDSLRHVLGSLPFGAALYSADGALIEANDGFLQLAAGAAEMPFPALFGCAPEEVAGHSGSFSIAGKHLAVAASAHDGTWLVQAQDITGVVEQTRAGSEISARDTLTGLATRAQVLPELRRIGRERASPVAVLMIDLDRFKSVNDTLGHGIGDQLLVKVGERLKSAVRPSDLLARMGGDEFVVLQFGGEQPAGAESLAKRLVELVGRPYIVDGHMVDIGASVGITIAEEGQPEKLLKQADIALYRAKQAGRGRYTFFEQRMDDEMQERRMLEIDLRRAVAFRQFELHYQPQLCLHSQRVTGMEALIRWQHPERGLINPNMFVPLAEETALIVPIGEWVIRQACEDAASWNGELNVAVNVSAKQLISGKLVNTVKEALAHAGLAARRLEVEITESVLMTDCESTLETLHALRALGVKVSMDDFGTGYSSLSYLSSFPFDKIKIDQSFVRAKDPAKADGIIRAITAIGEHLGMTTIAEGVETSAQLSALALTGCGSVQGFLLSKAVPASQVPALLDRLALAPLQPRKEEDAPAAITESNLYRLVYYSENRILGLDEEVRQAVGQILDASRRNNAAVGVTGALMFTSGFFAQVLEGERAEVERIFERIQIDDRHGDVRLLSFEPAPLRMFRAWAMAFVGLDANGRSRFGHLAASSDFDFEAADADAMCQKLRRLLEEEDSRAIAA
jgi:diguanylate cyclase (GGDEF)-like protein